MGCSDVSEFEHIYGQIFTTPSCVYKMHCLHDGCKCADRVKDVDRHLFFDRVKSLGIDSCLYEIPKNDWVDDMRLWPLVTFPDVYGQY